MDFLETLPAGTFQAQTGTPLNLSNNNNQIVEDENGNFWELLPNIINAGANVVDSYFGANTPDNVVYVTENEGNNSNWIVIVVVLVLLVAFYFLIK